jgi:hypothetical protein
MGEASRSVYSGIAVSILYTYWGSHLSGVIVPGSIRLDFGWANQNILISGASFKLATNNNSYFA